ncbi:hypothetical protein ILYODFUR_025705 [Ilyodon furcidens]|uniref:Uncharacterized protein n=1 Tax=Ilyodon furcidens TaxID=33524 RepID=A0ABV0T064_9TELE
MADPLPHLFSVLNSTTTYFNTTFELADVGLGSFHTRSLFAIWVEGWEKERAFWSGSGLGVRSCGSIGLSALSGLFEFFGISVPVFGAYSIAWGTRFQRGALGWSVCGSDWGVGAPPWLGCGYGGIPGLWYAVVAFL